MPNHLKQHHADLAREIKFAVRSAFKYTAGFDTLDYISDILDETLFYPGSTMADEKTPCRVVFFDHLAKQGFAVPPEVQDLMTELRDPYFFLLGLYLNKPIAEPEPEPTYEEEHARLSAEIVAMQRKRLGSAA